MERCLWDMSGFDLEHPERQPPNPAPGLGSGPCRFSRPCCKTFDGRQRLIVEHPLLGSLLQDDVEPEWASLVFSSVPPHVCGRPLRSEAQFRALPFTLTKSTFSYNKRQDGWMGGLFRKRRSCKEDPQEDTQGTPKTPGVEKQHQGQIHSRMARRSLE